MKVESIILKASLNIKFLIINKIQHLITLENQVLQNKFFVTPSTPTPRYVEMSLIISIKEIIMNMQNFIRHLRLSYKVCISSHGIEFIEVIKE